MGNRWQLVTRVLLVPPARPGGCVGLHIVPGPRLIAAWTDVTVLQLVVAREDFEVLWEGEKKDVWGVGWAGDCLVLRTRREVRGIVAPWRKAIWSVPDKLEKGILWADQLVLPRSGGYLQFYDTKDGSLLNETHLGIEKVEALRTLDNHAIIQGEDEMAWFDLAARSIVARYEVGEVLGPGGASPLSRRVIILGCDDGTLVLRRGTVLVGLDTSRRSVRWRVEIPRSYGGVVAHGTVCLQMGSALGFVDVRTGKLELSARGSLPLVHQGGGRLWQDSLVVVDEYGHIVTIDLRNRRLADVQQQKGASFNQLEVLDGRLVIAGMDGALWIFDRSTARPSARAKGRRRPAGEPRTTLGRVRRRPSNAPGSPGSGRSRKTRQR